MFVSTRLHYLPGFFRHFVNALVAFEDSWHWLHAKIEAYDRANENRSWLASLGVHLSDDEVQDREKEYRSGFFWERTELKRPVFARVHNERCHEEADSYYVAYVHLFGPIYLTYAPRQHDMKSRFGLAHWERGHLMGRLHVKVGAWGRWVAITYPTFGRRNAITVWDIKHGILART